MEKDITLTIIKPKAVKNGFAGPILAKINEAGFRIQAIKAVHLSHAQAAKFYSVHKGKSFFDSLIIFMTSGPVIAAILEKENAVDVYRKLIGATNPEDADDGSIRKLFGTTMQANAVHGSDSNANAIIEAAFFFAETERF